MTDRRQQHPAGSRALQGTVAGTTPYAWPWDGAIDLDALALLVVRPSPPQGGEPEARLTALRSAAASAGVPVITVLTRWPEGVDEPSGRIVRSPGWNGFYDSPLDTELRRRGLTHLLLAGHWMEIGVHSTMRAANDMGYECLLVADATTAAEPELVASSISQIEMSGGIFGAVGATTEVIASLNAARSLAQSEPIERSNA